MSKAIPTTQPAGDRRAAEAMVASIVEKVAPEHAKVVAGVRRLLRKRLPTACEVVYEYRDWMVISVSPNDRGYAGVFAIRASAEGVKLYFNQGKDLDDPEKALKGSGTQTRWIDVERATTLKQPVVAGLIEQAIERNRVPFDEQGRGSVVLKTKPAKAAKKVTSAKTATKRRSK